MKKTISLVLICCMLALMLPSASIETAAATPSVEDILNDYHAKAFDAQVSGETGGASTYSRSGGSGQTLEQETVDTLNEAGYEAYNVTAENYDALEESLQTDFTNIGLDRNGSYIIVISGEEQDTGTTNPNARVDNVPSYDLIDQGAGGNFLYEYNGNYYTMRYMTVAANETCREKEVMIAGLFDPDVSVEEILSCMFSLAGVVIDLVQGFIEKNIGSIASIFGIDLDNTYEITGNSLTLSASAAWTHKYVQILDEDTDTWCLAGRAEYAYVEDTFSGSFFNFYTGETTDYCETRQQTVYSLYYNDLATLKERSAAEFYGGNYFLNRTGNIDIILKQSDGTNVVAMTLYEGL